VCGDKRARPLRFVEHRYLADRELHNFLMDIIGFAKRRIIVVSPYVHKTDITKKLGRIKNKKTRDRKVDFPVIFYTRKPNQNDRWNYKRNKEGFDFLYDCGFDVREKKKTHAKIVIIDDEIAIVSSFNWTDYPSQGDSWDSGIVTFDIEIIDEIGNSLKDMT